MTGTWTPAAYSQRVTFAFQADDFTEETMMRLGYRMTQENC